MTNNEGEEGREAHREREREKGGERREGVRWGGRGREMIFVCAKQGGSLLRRLFSWVRAEIEQTSPLLPLVQNGANDYFTTCTGLVVT